ncbi:KipI family sensor histidine kinase inhibitor [Yoonia maricola]|uniref:KipI family sensor histidine kinase inhibitor n=1 Tax=Yoonia maricola TaxID=420999 RepID=A0A2M8W6D3_9RHOB|nr:carboxyltransferase domain-containing protein [Yoonia maricola]PJI86488.1 KipI family sensor histidine kinase inhibitor [Yoonia maricola]
MTALDQTPELLPLGIDGVLVRFATTLTEDANAHALGFRDLVQDMALVGVTEVASSLVSVRVGFDPAQTDRATVMGALRSLLEQHQTKDEGPRRLWRIPAAFGTDFAPQLGEVAGMAGLTPQQAITEIEATQVRVIAIGFAPGQPYLGMLPDHWNIPRQTELTKKLPRGALITAVRQLIIWAADAPTGWRHIGQTAFRVYRPETTQPFAFEPGDAVQFQAVSDTDFRAIKVNTDTNGGATCEVLR